MWGVLSHCKDFAISVNLGCHICFHAAGLPGGVFTHCLKIFGTLVLWLGAVHIKVVIAEGMTRGLEHPRKVGVRKESQEWALWHLLLLSLLDSRDSSSAIVGHQEGVTMTQGDEWSFKRTCSSLNMVNSLMHLLSSLTHSGMDHPVAEV